MDGLLDRLVHRPLASLLVRLLLRLPVSPNMVTLAGLAMGLIAAREFWHATPRSALAGIVAYFLSSVADHADGQLARLTGRATALGRWLDIFADTVIQILIALAMAASARAQGGDTMLWLGVTAASWLALSAVCVNFLPPRAPRPGFSASLLRALANRDPFYGVLVAFLVIVSTNERLLPGLVWILAAGSQAYWLAYLGVRS
ncbi:MAG TPA: CDP-alcohol phosphatidyltransferase family protein [Methylomirabilota bacterium]|nr:CDP-alcohol phosphatidyltransferase family protein [Methylomirabilota bacterium]